MRILEIFLRRTRPLRILSSVPIFSLVYISLPVDNSAIDDTHISRGISSSVYYYLAD